MKTSLSLLTAGILSAFSANASDLVISGVIDGPLTGGIPKAVELYVVNDIADLSVYGIGTANNGGGTDGVEFTFPADSASAGSYIYVASEIDGFTTFFGSAPDYDSSAMGINGDDAIELFQNETVKSAASREDHVLNGSKTDPFLDISYRISQVTWIASLKMLWMSNHAKCTSTPLDPRGTHALRV